MTIDESEKLLQWVKHHQPRSIRLKRQALEGHRKHLAAQVKGLTEELRDVEEKIEIIDAQTSYQFCP